ncbi:hypothetical protein [Terrihalobacillus insolitus]|nr:hypothetical protein [Terrihalobacillus insolitus]
MTPKMIERIYHYLGNSTQVYNAYGPTEATECSFIKDSKGIYHQ